MDKELELRLDPKALKAAIAAADSAYEVLPDGPGGTTPSVFHPDVIGAAISTYLARRSSDEQAEVVGYVTEDALKLMREAKPGSGWRYHMFAKDRTDPKALVALFASPPAVAKGGVTEEMVEAACMANINPLSAPSDAERNHMRRALTAALAVGDEGIREGDDGKR